MIKINDEYYIKADDKNLVLYEKRINSKEGEAVIGYFGTIDHALEYLMKHTARKIVAEKDYTLKQALEDIKKYNDELIKAIRGED